MASSYEHDNASSILFNFENGSNVVNFDENYDDDSDGTIMGDEFENRFVRSSPTPEVIFVRDESAQPASHDLTQTHLDTYSADGRTYRVGKTVELRNGDFLRITAVMRDPNSGSVSLRGLEFRRNKMLDGMVESKRNEVTMMLTFDEDDSRDIYHQSLKTVQLSEVIRFRELIKTNLLFPSVSFRESDPNWRSQGKDFITNNGRIVCRTRLVREAKKGGSLLVLDETEADEAYGVAKEELRCGFRGETEKGGMCPRWLDGEKIFESSDKARSRGIDPLHFHRHRAALQDNTHETFDLTDDEPYQARRYTFGDAFSGPGGASRGAKAAGLRNEFAFDFDPATIDTYRRNFHHTRCEAIAAHEFVTVINEDFKVDVLHMSPPCQTFSPYHVHQGKNDELNQATFLAIEELLKKTRPRIVTLEETFGLSRMRKHKDWLHAMIRIFSKLGFSIRWRVFNLSDFGLPQPRKRLFVFASWYDSP